jgi:hypothetical protein
MRKKIFTIGWAVVMLVAITVSNGFCWGSAVHAYIGDELGVRMGVKNFDEIYGAMAPDVFNYTFAAYYPFLYTQTHYYDFNTKEVAYGPFQNALAYGYASHNGVWGADFTAHHSGITYGQGQGYVVAKAKELMPILGYALAQNGITLSDDVLLEVCHNLTEASIDILMKRVDPNIGIKITEAAILRAPAFPSMLVRAYGENLAAHAGMTPNEAAKTIIAAENNFRRITVLYGVALTKPEAQAAQLLAENFASMASDFMAMMGVTLPDGVDLTPLAAFGIQQGIALCTGDFRTELKATLKTVEKNMKLY